MCSTWFGHWLGKFTLIHPDNVNISDCFETKTLPISWWFSLCATIISPIHLIKLLDSQVSKLAVWRWWEGDRSESEGSQLQILRYIQLTSNPPFQSSLFCNSYYFSDTCPAYNILYTHRQFDITLILVTPIVTSLSKSMKVKVRKWRNCWYVIKCSVGSATVSWQPGE